MAVLFLDILIFLSIVFYINFVFRELITQSFNQSINKICNIIICISLIILSYNICTIYFGNDYRYMM